MLFGHPPARVVTGVVISVRAPGEPLRKIRKGAV